MEPLVILCTCYLLFGSDLVDIYTSGDLETYHIVRWLDFVCLLVFYIEFILLCSAKGTREYIWHVRMVLDVLVILGLQFSFYHKTTYRHSDHTMHTDWYNAILNGITAGGTAARTIKLPRLLGWFSANLIAVVTFIHTKTTQCWERCKRTR